MRASTDCTASLGVTGAAGRAFAADAATDFLSGKTPSRENIETAAALVSENTDCLSDHYASAEYRASLVKTEITRALASLLALSP